MKILDVKEEGHTNPRWDRCSFYRVVEIIDPSLSWKAGDIIIAGYSPTGSKAFWNPRTNTHVRSVKFDAHCSIEKIKPGTYTVELP